MNATLLAGETASDTRYDAATIWLHWVTAFLVFGLWGLGQVADAFPRGTPQSIAWSVHVAAGLAFALVIAARVAWRIGFGRAVPPLQTGPLHHLARVTHFALYALLVAAAATGIANASYRGFNVFGVWTMPQFGSADRATRRMLNEWHEWSANLILFVSLFHAAAALVHHYVWRDRLLHRMR